MDDAQFASQTTGDAEQQRERDEAEALEMSSEEEWGKMTDAEKQAELDAIAAWNAQSKAREIMPSEYTYASLATEREEERLADLARRQTLWDERSQVLAQQAAKQTEILEQCKKDYPWSANYPDFYDKPKWTNAEGLAMLKLKESGDEAYWGTKRDCFEREHKHWKSTGQDYLRKVQAPVLDADLLANFDDIMDDYNAYKQGFGASPDDEDGARGDSRF
jgi:hypothetical protein